MVPPDVHPRERERLAQPFETGLLAPHRPWFKGTVGRDGFGVVAQRLAGVGTP